MDEQTQSSPSESKPRPSEPLPPHPAFATVVKVRHSRRPLWVVLAILLIIGGSYGAYYWQHQKVTTLQSQLITVRHSLAQLQSTSKIQSSPGSSSGTAGPGLVQWDFLDSNLQKAILARWQIVSPGYSTAPSSVCKQPQNQAYWVEVDQFVKDQDAVVSVGCDSPEQDILTNVNGTWKTVSSGQDGISCTTILQYGLPTELLIKANNGSSECLLPDGSTQQLGT